MPMLDNWLGTFCMLKIGVSTYNKKDNAYKNETFTR